MRFPLISRARPAKQAEVTFDPLEMLPKDFDQALDFWYIKAHDRETLIYDTMPYMACSLRKLPLLQEFMNQHIWAEELVSSEFHDTIEQSLGTLDHTMTAFWIDPVTVTANLLRLTRLWFFLLLRYTYRIHFLQGREVSRSDLNIRDLCNKSNYHFVSAFTNDTIYRLTQRRNRYGTSFYKRRYKDAKERLAWTSFCDKIQTLCRLVGLHTSSDFPEENLRELRRNLTPIMMHRNWSHVSGQLTKNNSLVRNTRRDVMKQEEQIISSAMHHSNAMEETQKEIQDLKRQCDEFGQSSPLLLESQQKHTELLAQLEKSRTTYELRLKDLERDIKQSNQVIKQLSQSVDSKFRDLNRPNNIITQRKDCITAEVLIICRWLLEHLPTTNLKQNQLGQTWQRFWDIQWAQCKGKLKPTSHPVQCLIGDIKYNKIGKCLYSTLSDRLHKYGLQKNDKLHPDVEKVIRAIGPVHYDNSGRVDLVAERKRWAIT